MSTPDRWIVIPRWWEFQHYKNRDPKWIKAYTRLLNDAEYLALSWRLRGLLHGLWLLYAASDGQLPASPAVIATRLGVPTEWEERTARARRVDGESTASFGRDDGEEPLRKRALERLEQAGFITFSASKPLALRYQAASPEVEVEKKELPRARAQGNGNTAPAKTTGPTVCPICGADRKLTRKLDDHLKNVHSLYDEGERAKVLAGATT